jgi:hypothetical protein
MSRQIEGLEVREDFAGEETGRRVPLLIEQAGIAA